MNPDKIIISTTTFTHSSISTTAKLLGNFIFADIMFMQSSGHSRIRFRLAHTNADASAVHQSNLIESGRLAHSAQLGAGNLAFFVDSSTILSFVYACNRYIRCNRWEMVRRADFVADIFSCRWCLLCDIENIPISARDMAGLTVSMRWIEITQTKCMYESLDLQFL